MIWEWKCQTYSQSTLHRINTNIAWSWTFKFGSDIMITCSTLCSQYSQHIGFYHNIDHCKQYFPSHVQFSLSPFPETSSSTDCMAAALALSLARYSFLAMASRTHLGSGLMTHCSHTATTSSRCSNPNTVPTTYLAVKFGCRGMGRCVVCVD